MSKTTHRQPAGDTAPSLRQRAARLRNDAGRFIKRGAAAPDADQPQPASLPDSIPASGPAEGFSSVEQPSHDAARGQPEDQSRDPADAGPVPHGEHDMGRHESFESATPIAEDLLSGTALGRMHGAGGPDPIFAMIQEAWRLTREHGRLHALCADKDDDHPSWGPEREAHAAMWGYIRGTLIATVPTTSEGCKALARCVLDLSEVQGAPLCGETESNDPVLALIAQSPLVDRPRASGVETSVAAKTVTILIEAHRIASAALATARNPADEEFVRQAGGDTSDEVMTPAREAWEVANAAETDAWDALLAARPADAAGLARMLRYIAESPASEIVGDPHYLLGHLAEAAEAIADDPFEGRPCPSGFVPYPFDKPTAWLKIRHALRMEGERLLQLAAAEADRLAPSEEDFPDEGERRSRETRLHRSLRIDALMALAGRMDPSTAPLPEPGSEAAVAAFQAACGEATRLGQDAITGYPELKRNGVSTWTKEGLTRALEKGEVPPAEFARLYMLASEREYRHEAALIASNIGALHALAFPDRQRVEDDEDEEGPAADADLIALGQEFEAAAAAATELVAESRRLSAAGADREAVAAAEGRASDGDDVAEDIADRIADMRATTVEGYGVKLRAAAYFQGPFGEDYPCERLLTSLIRDAGPAPVSAPHEPAAPDPILAVIAENRRLRLAWTASFDLPTQPPHNDPHPDTLDAQDAFNAHTADVLLETVPHTAEGCKALARYALDLYEDDDSLVLDDDGENRENWCILDLIARSPATSSGGDMREDAGRVRAATALEVPAAPIWPDLSDCTLPQLARLYDAVNAVWLHLGAAGRAPCFWDKKRENFNPAGTIMADEEDRLCRLLDAITTEARGRATADIRERGERLAILFRADPPNAVGGPDGALLAEIASTWGKP